MGPSPRQAGPPPPPLARPVPVEYTPRVDPAVWIVVAVLAVTAGMMGWSVHLRRQVLRRREALRQAERVEIPVVSVLRGVGIALPLVLLPPALIVVPAILLDQTREHALAVVVGVIVLSSVAIMASIPLVQRLARVGQLVLDAQELVLEMPGERVAIALDRNLRLREAVVPGGQRVETLVIISQDEDASFIAFRYPCLVREKSLAPGGVTAPPMGILLGPEARVVHERLSAMIGK